MATKKAGRRPALDRGVRPIAKRAPLTNYLLVVAVLAGCKLLAGAAATCSLVGALVAAIVPPPQANTVLVEKSTAMAQIKIEPINRPTRPPRCTT